MKDFSALHLWMTAGEVLELMRDETGLNFSAHDLLDFFNRDHCAAYLDCSFAPGRMGGYQHLAPRIKGAGHCRLLDSLAFSTRPETPPFALTGPVIVRGMAWVYSLEKKLPRQEEGIWRFDFGSQSRPLLFERAEVLGLCRRIVQNGVAEFDVAHQPRRMG